MIFGYRAHESLAASDISDHILVEAIRDTNGRPTLCGLVMLVNGYRRGQVTLDGDSAAVIKTIEDKASGMPEEPSWGEYADTFVQTIRSETGTI